MIATASHSQMLDNMTGVDSSSPVTSGPDQLPKSKEPRPVYTCDWLIVHYGTVKYITRLSGLSKHSVLLLFSSLLICSGLCNLWFSYHMTGRVENYVTRRHDNGSHTRPMVGTTKKADADLLCMFTTFKPSMNKNTVYRNVLVNWMSLAPKGVVRAILFDTTLSPINFNDSTIMKVKVTKNANSTRPHFMQQLIDVALKLGWHVFNLSRVSPLGVPYFKDMYFEAAKHFPKCKFYGFANGDIMFDEGLIRTLEAVDKATGSLKELLLIGRRTNVETKKLKTPVFFRPHEVNQLAKSFGQLYHSLAKDYFIVYKNRFPWHVVPDVVIGRIRYDNFIVWKAFQSRVSVIDVTQTVVALHQTDSEGNKAGFRSQYHDVNTAIMGKFDVCQSGTDRAKMYTVNFAMNKLTSVFDQQHVVSMAGPAGRSPGTAASEKIVVKLMFRNSTNQTRRKRRYRRKEGSCGEWLPPSS